MTRVTIVVDVLADPEGSCAGTGADAPGGVEQRTPADRRSGHERRGVTPHPSAATAPGESRPYRFRSFRDRRAECDRRMPTAPETCGEPCRGGTAADDERASGADAFDASSAPSREEILVRIADGDENGSSIHWLHVRL